MNQHEMWSQRYRATGEDYLFGTAPNRFLEQHAGLFRPGQRALSVADGEGRNSVWLAAQGLEVTAVEYTEVAVEKARRLAAARGVAVGFEVGDILAADWPPPLHREAYDWVVAIFIQFAGPGERPAQMAGLKAAARSGGGILLQGYTPKQVEYRTGGPPHAENMYTEPMLRELFADWRIEELVEYEDDISEGSGHKGRSALIGMVARKP